MYSQLTTIPRIDDRDGKKESIEWQIPHQVSAAFMFIDKFGYSFIAKVKVKKKYWWSRSWKTFVTHDPDSAAAISKGEEFLESYGFRIDPDTARLEEKTSDYDQF